ncbi:SCY1-like protein 2 isoform X2 [Haliotis rubra]|uniref:SCY1-like protein 2 isoform X2 n=1 Tax=Haliotis rubra TaxID=36100 RepID=UPI001EE4F839|nr:SCY1-like protein 2 isoform X2 [Haliotis rubra]
MDMFNRLKSAVTNALPGNPLSRDFDLYNQIASGGPGMLWKIHGGMKKTTKQESSIFVFEKRSLERYSRRDREMILESLRKGVQQLTKLRHPKVLSVMEPLEESRETLAFATEPVFCSLANVLGNHDNMTTVPKELQEYELYDVEVRHGLLQMIEGLTFLHNDAKILHHNICPESIILNKNGTWKLAGFDFCALNSNTTDQSLVKAGSFVPMFAFKEWDADIPPCCQPHLDYLAPEYALTMMCSLASDMYSIGVLIYALFNNGKPLFECRTQLSTFKKNAEELRHFRSTLLGSIPDELRDYVKLLLNIEATVRPDPAQLSKVSFFEDVGTMTLQYMDTLFQRDNLQKSQFFKGLPKIAAKLPKRVNQQRILPALYKECVNPDMVPFVLPTVLLVAEQSTNREYLNNILPELIPLFKIHDPVQISLIFLQNMSLLLSKTPQQDIKTHILPMIYRALEVDNPQIQELCLNIVPTFAELIEYSSLKNVIVPRIKKLCQSTSTLTIRVNCLLCLGKLLEYMDRWYVLDEIIPFLPQIPSREPAVLMSILGIYKVTMVHAKLGMTKDILANKVIPFLMPLCIDNNLNLSQFNAFVGTVREMFHKVESEQRTKLEQLDQMKQEQKTLEISKVSSKADSNLIPEVAQEKNQTMMDKFLSGFGIAGLMGGSQQTESTGGPAPVAASSTPRPTAQPTGTAKVSLSLEEKQRLARQQEQEQKLKVQRPLSAQNTQNKPKTNDKVKDLTSTLMDTNLRNMSTTTPKSQPMSSMGGQSGPVIGRGGMSSSYGVSSPPSVGSGGYAGMNTGGSFAGMNNNSSGFGVVNNSPGFGGSGSMNTGGGNKPKMDMSAFDSLLPSSNQPRKSMNEMAQTRTAGMPGQQGMMGGQRMGMGGNVGMMGNQGMMGSPGMMGYQQNMNGGFGQMSNQMNFGGMGNTGSMPMSNSSMLTPQSSSQMKPSGNDLADIFG